MKSILSNTLYPCLGIHLGLGIFLLSPCLG